MAQGLSVVDRKSELPGNTFVNQVMNKTSVFLAVLVILIAGCSNKAVYENIQINNRNDCKKLPLPQYEDCMKHAKKSHESFEREREALPPKLGVVCVMTRHHFCHY
jgi:hypothetical protein